MRQSVGDSQPEGGKSMTGEKVENQIKRAAAELFAERGFIQTRIADIVAKAGTAQGTFYLYFRSKPSVFVSLVDDFFAGLMAETLERHPAKKLLTSEQMVLQVETIWSAIIEHCRKNAVLTKLVLREAAALPSEQRDHIARHFERGAAALVSYVDEARRRDLVNNLPSQLVAWLIIGMIERAMHYAVFIAPDTPSAELARHCTEFELFGLLTADAHGARDSE